MGRSRDGLRRCSERRTAFAPELTFQKLARSWILTVVSSPTTSGPFAIDPCKRGFSPDAVDAGTGRSNGVGAKAPLTGIG